MTALSATTASFFISQVRAGLLLAVRGNMQETLARLFYLFNILYFVLKSESFSNAKHSTCSDADTAQQRCFEKKRSLFVGGSITERVMKYHPL
jgi:hypothetical protein